MNNGEIYNHLSLLTRVSPERLLESVANTVTSMWGIKAIAAILTTRDGLDIMARLASDTPQGYSGVVTGIFMFEDGSANIHYVEEAGCRLGLAREKKELIKLKQSGLKIGSVIRVTTESEKGQQLVKQLEVLEMPVDAKYDFVERVILNHSLNGLSKGIYQM